MTILVPLISAVVSALLAWFLKGRILHFPDRMLDYAKKLHEIDEVTQESDPFSLMCRRIIRNKYLPKMAKSAYIDIINDKIVNAHKADARAPSPYMYVLLMPILWSLLIFLCAGVRASFHEVIGSFSQLGNLVRLVTGDIAPIESNDTTNGLVWSRAGILFTLFCVLFLGWVAILQVTTSIRWYCIRRISYSDFLKCYFTDTQDPDQVAEKIEEALGKFNEVYANDDITQLKSATRKAAKWMTLAQTVICFMAVSGITFFSNLMILLTVLGMLYFTLQGHKHSMKIKENKKSVQINVSCNV